MPLSYCTDVFGAPVVTDQRGVARPNGPACDSGSVDVSAVPTYQICLLYDPLKAVKSGATIPIKLQLCDGSGGNLSSAGIVVQAVSLTQISSSISGTVEEAGDANPDSNFRFDPALGGTGGYIFNLKTTGLATGTYKLNFTVGSGVQVYSAAFQVK